MRKQRYEILLPLTPSDGRRVSDQLIRQTYEELVSQFRGISSLPHTVLGAWWRAGPDLEDRVLQLLVDAEDSPDSLRFFRRFKATLQERFAQMDVYIVSYPIEIL